jgi:hypothetical protein
MLSPFLCRGPFPSGVRNFSFLQNVLIDSGSHPVSSLGGVRAFYARLKSQGLNLSSQLYLVPKLKNKWS